MSKALKNITKLKDTVDVVADFGADPTGSVDSTTAIQAAINTVAAAGGGVITFPPSTSFKCSQGLTIDTNKVGIVGNGATLSFPSLSSGYALSVTNSNANAGYRTLLNSTHPITGINFIGPGVGATSTCAVNLNDTSGVNSLSGVRFNNCSFREFASDVNFGIGAFCNTFNQCQFTVSSVPTTYSVTVGTAANAGERNEFISCTWFNRPFVLTQTNVSADTYFTNCSIDYCNLAMSVFGGYVTLTSCHIEDNYDAGWMYTVSSYAYSTISFSNCCITLSAAKSLNAPFYSDAAVTHGGIFVNGGEVVQGNTWTTRLIDGTGNGYARNVVFENQIPVISSSQNSLAYGNFESTSWAADWTALTGATPPSRSTAQFHAGTASMLLAGSTTNSPGAAVTYSIQPGQYATVEWWDLVQSLTGSGGTFYCSLTTMDRGGNTIQNYSYTVTTTVASWAKNQLYMTNPTGPGVYQVKLQFGVFGVTSGTPNAYVDDVVLTIS